MKKLVTLSTAALAATIALAGCSATTDTGSMPGMDHSTHGSASSAAPSSTTGGQQSAGHNAADTMFAQMMIPHHAQAVQMSEAMLAKGGLDPRVRGLALKIKDAQAPEIETLTGWLATWGEPTTMGGGHTMSGMLTEAELSALAAAEGTEASKLFLAQMTAHHEGAIEMARTEVAAGLNADAVALATAIASSQDTEIKDMQQLLAAL
ncbi:DUF305 domain-containing protein [Arthrobacter sp. 35W]|uniref:DUF305 domain-containing protein n=1 Tax=Arthrobacter sp. 35W TaxID=1132441 RepID=UPI000421748F|nr:DUF305 domain-containing protein [Arthrobacter sp. 35W]